MRKAAWVGVGAAAVVALAATFWAVAANDRPESRDPSIQSHGEINRPASAPAMVEEGAASRTVERSTVPETELRITGRVVDSTGRGIPGARVVSFPDVLNEIIDPFGSTLHAMARLATSDHDGHFSIAVDPSADFFDLGATAKGFAGAVLGPIRVGADALIRLAAQSFVLGTVRTLEGAPVPRARVQWTSGVAAVAFRTETLCDDRGEYRVACGGDIFAGRARWSHVAVAAEGFAPFGTFAPAVIDGRFDMWLPRGATVHGRVVDAWTGLPIPRARIGVTPQFTGGNAVVRPGGGYVHFIRSHVAGTTVADGEGAYRIGSLAVAGLHNHNRFTQQLLTYAPGYFPITVQLNDFSDGETVEAPIRMVPSAAAFGLVVDASGKPILGVHVRIDQDTTAAVKNWVDQDALRQLVPDAASPQRTTDSEGRWSLPLIPLRNPDSSSVRLRVDGAPIREPILESVDLVRGAATGPIVLTFRGDLQARRASILVTDPSSRPLTGASVSMYPEGEALGGVRTDRDGRALVSFSPREFEHRVFVWAPGFGFAASEWFTPTLNEPLTVTVRLAPERRVSGRVTWSDGQPAGGFFVTASGDDDSQSALGTSMSSQSASRRRLTSRPTEYGSASTNEDGYFEVGGLPDGECDLRAAGTLPLTESGGVIRSFNSVLRNVPSGSRDVIIALSEMRPSRPRGSLTVQVVSAVTSKPVGCVVAILGNSGAPQQVARPTGVLGEFRFDSVAAGSWSLRVRAPGYALALRQVTVTDLPESVQIQLSRDTGLTGRVRLPAGAPLDDVQINFERDDGEQLYATVESDGSFRLAGLIAGRRYRVTALARGGETRVAHLINSDSEWIEVETDEPAREFAMESAGAIAFPYPMPKTGQATIMTSTGEFVIRRHFNDRHVPMTIARAGEYVVRAELDGAEPKEIRVTVPPGGSGQVKF